MRRFVLLIFATVYAQNGTFVSKPKRTLIDVQSPGDAKPVGIVYHLEPTTEDPNLGHFYTNSQKYFPHANKPVFDGEKLESSNVNKNVFETPKVAAQHVLYEYEQTPTNAVSNVHVKHIFQPTSTNSNNNDYQEVKKEPNSYISSAETVVSPVQHSSFVNHAQVNYHPLYTVQPQHPVQHHVAHPYVPSRYLYVNGKIVYQPVHQPTQQHVQRQHYHPNQQLQQYQPLYQNKQHHNLPLIQHRPVQKLTPPPVAFTNFHPPARSEMQRITNPVTPKTVEVEDNDEERDEKEDLREEEEENDDEDDRKENLEERDEEEAEEDDDKHDKYHHLFGKYSFENEDDEEEDERPRYRSREESNEEDEDEDTDRKPSKISSKTKKPKKSKYNDKDNYSYSEAYMTSSKYEQKPKKSSKNSKSKPKRHYRKVKYTSNSKGKPKFEVIEGKSSQQVPITHEHKFVKEKFYITKSFNDEFDKLEKN